MDNQAQITRLHRVWLTVNQMVLDRGYVVAENETTITREEFQNTYGTASGVDRTALRQFFRHKESNSQLYVEFSTNTETGETIGIKPLRAFAATLAEHQCAVGIYVYAGKLSPSASKVALAVAAQHSIELFPESDLIVNITQHELVPKHEVLSKEEKLELLEKYRLKETQLPRILPVDPVARYYGLKRGQVVKITRRSPTSGRYNTYRICM
ncbi:RPB5 subunit of DNA-directed RNA polymerase [Saitoella complicata NRRL Y-17804]|uniref:RPB5 subunit of DNA-directed RNA polymerase n=1 Tax=Saitoella complicata (strain BCRC 22490 / CBS 7301 / JCM 7358 / NBRC 10748 / NRRL Y-17804) TaxID=698492 RepID=UPI000867CBF2|nr:RPB5 subunit of DNA-directed RNA polymerase [Saitoella complicata NRRL Y-17804]ODQ55377.1 RPB5 subunit of DNA-directed RNA polymerase [Saitoella complicata NRRL Y-17804]